MLHCVASKVDLGSTCFLDGPGALCVGTPALLADCPGLQGLTVSDRNGVSSTGKIIC